MSTAISNRSCCSGLALDLMSPATSRAIAAAGLFPSLPVAAYSAIGFFVAPASLHRGVAYVAAVYAITLAVLVGFFSLVRIATGSPLIRFAPGLIAGTLATVVLGALPFVFKHMYSSGLLECPHTGKFDCVAMPFAYLFLAAPAFPFFLCLLLIAWLDKEKAAA